MSVRMKRRLFYFFLCFGIGIFCIGKIFRGLSESDIRIIPGYHRQIQTGSSTSGKKFGRHDIHVVVGYYQGNSLSWVHGENLTDEVLNTNMYSPDPFAGQNGEAVLIPSFESPKMNKLFQINRFNLMASDRIPLNRSLPDVRRKQCRGISYENLPTTSVIIVFHNEAWSTLLRTVHSVINQSPRAVLAEIILVDDASQRRFLMDPLESHLITLPVPTRIIRSKDRIGLIKARLLGAKVAVGEVLTFLDAHCECTIGWLEPLLHQIKVNRKSIVSPVIDIINDETFQYVRSFELHQGGFNWELHFRWFSLPPDLIVQRQPNPTKPFNTPVMAGGLFSIDKEFFYEIGSYDEKMEIWGGENIEISFRGWMCGATLQIVPCSHVGHLFRKSSPYSFPGGVGDILHANLARVALVWMDEWKDFYFKIHPEVAAQASNQSVQSRLQLRKELGCKSFEWYLTNVWSSHFFPAHDRFIGKIRNAKSKNCLQSPKNTNYGQPYGSAMLYPCTFETYPIQIFIITPDGFIKTNDAVCLDSPEYRTSSESEVRIMACNDLDRQKWKFDSNSRQIQHVLSDKCLDLNPKHIGAGLVLRKCSKKLKSQQWILEDMEWTSNKRNRID